MTRSFIDRVFGGVCGGLGAALRINAWWVRGLFAVLTVVSQGAFAVPYLLLWWIAPAQSPSARRPRSLSLLIVLGLLLLVGAGWVLRDQGLLRAENGADLFWPVSLGLLALVFFLKQLGGGSR